MSSNRLTIASAIATLLAGISLYPLFIGTAWFWGGMGATITVAGIGTLTRLRRLPVAVCLAATALGLVLYLNLVFEARHSFGHVLPTLRSLDLLGRLARTGVSEAGKYAPPAPELSGLMLLGIGGIGVVALLTDLVAVRLRSVAVAGVPLLLLITEPFAISASRSGFGTVIAFCLGTAGYLGMLGAESRQRIRDWEQPRPGGYDGPDTSALSAAGRRVGIASVVFALFLPVFVPGLHVTRLVGGQPGIGGNGSGGGGAGFPAPETVVSQQLQESKPQPVLTYNALGSGTTVPQYLQLYVLDQLTDAGWQLASQPAVTLSTSRGVMPPPPGLTLQRGYDVVEDGTPREVRTVPGATSVATSVQLSPDLSTVAQLKTRVAAVLPVPYPATQVVAPGDWQATQADLTVSSPATAVASSVVRYDVFSAQLQPSPAALAAAGPPPAAIKRSYLSLPPSYLASGQLGALVGEITGGQQTAYGKAEAIEAWLSDSGTFSYSLKAPTVTSALQLQSFLTTTRKGYCQQFAVAMADLARLAGIPSRVVIGYTSGSRQSDGSWKVTTRDAHEWPELYFSGYGWLRFEPTPGGLDGQGSATVPAYASQSTDTTGKGAPGEPPNLAIGPANVSPGPHQAGGGVRTLEGGPDGKVAIGSGEKATAVSALDIGGLVVAGLAVLALIAPGTARLVIRRRRWRRAARGGDAALAHVAWRELQDDLINYRAGYSASETPRALSARVGARVAATGTAGEAPEASVAALRRITLAEEQARYAAHPVPGDLLRRDSAEFHRALVATMPRRARWRARLLPLSVLVPAASGVSQAADAVGNVRLPRPRRGQLDSPGR